MGLQQTTTKGYASKVTQKKVEDSRHGCTPHEEQSGNTFPGAER